MKNIDKWIPSKYVIRRGRLRSSRNRKDVIISSRLSADLIAACYEKNIKMHAKGILLDLGCGKVPLYAAYKNYISNNICVDWDKSLHKNPHLDFEADLNADLAFASETFDTVVLSDVLEHIRNPEKLLSEISRVLRHGGKLLMNVPFYYWLHEEPYDFFRYTRHALDSMLNSVGFKNIIMEEYGGAPEVLTDIFAKTVMPLKMIGKPLASISQKMTSILLKTVIGDKISRATRAKFPLGYFAVAEKQ